MRALLGNLRHRAGHWLVTASVTLMGVAAIGAGVVLGVTTAAPTSVRPVTVTPAGQGVSVTPTRPVGTAPATTETSPVDSTVLAPATTAATAAPVSDAAHVAPGSEPTAVAAPDVPSVEPQAASPVDDVVQPVLGLVDGLDRTAPTAPATALTPR